MSKRRHLGMLFDFIKEIVRKVIWTDSELDINPKRSKTITGTNARFDRMIESISVVHHGGPARNASNAAKKRRGRSLSQLNDAYNPPPVDRLRRGLSFSKMGHESSSPSPYEDGPSSDIVEANIENSILLIIHVLTLLSRFLMPRPHVAIVGHATPFQSGWPILFCPCLRRTLCAFLSRRI